MDEIHFAPPKKPWLVMIPPPKCQTMASHGFQMVQDLVHPEYHPVIVAPERSTSAVHIDGINALQPARKCPNLVGFGWQGSVTWSPSEALGRMRDILTETSKAQQSAGLYINAAASFRAMQLPTMRPLPHKFAAQISLDLCSDPSPDCALGVAVE